MCLKVDETLADVLLVTSLEPVVEAPQQVSEIVQFTGRRLNSKMQVYSGSKPVCLSKMLTLYELCIRVLQNNIDCEYSKSFVAGCAESVSDLFSWCPSWPSRRYCLSLQTKSRSKGTYKTGFVIVLKCNF